MHTEKHKMSNCGLLRENDRSMYRNKDCISQSLIDHSKTHMNYNLCPHAQYSPEEIKAYQERITGKKMRKDGIAFGTTIITAPEELKNGNTESFFMIAYEGLKKTYGLKDEDIVSAYVHLDETTPHMHFNFIPHVYGEKETVSWEKVMPREKYKTQHKELEEYFKSYNWDLKLLNGKTKGIDMSKMTVEEKKLSMEIEKLQNENESLKMANTSLQEVYDSITSKISEYIKEMRKEVKKISLWKDTEHEHTHINALKALEEQTNAFMDDIGEILELDEYER